ncbi:MAG: hypothetical protein QNJ36_08595 [Calothrix sp. MO_167.B42]|nr:hypothetical protein [Calothrix sp. MO_167.B42]
MNTIFLRHGFLGLLSLTVLVAQGISPSAIAQTTESTNLQQDSLSIQTTDSLDGMDIQVKSHSQNLLTLTSEQSPASTIQEAQPPNITTLKPLLATTTPDSDNQVVTPIPGTVATSSTALNFQDVKPTTTAQLSTTEVAQTNILPGRATRGGKSYVGIGVNVGISGDDSALGDGNFSVLSKIGFTRNISVRPSAVINENNSVILVPITYDISIKDTADPFTEVLPFTPYVGAGAAFKLGDDSEVGLLLSGGIDFPLGSRFTANAAVNAGFFDDIDIGLLLGVGLNFPGF